jgi:hypothetical protein
VRRFGLALLVSLALILAAVQVARAGTGSGWAAGLFARWGVITQTGNPPGQRTTPRCATGRDHDVNDNSNPQEEPCITHSQSLDSHSG